MQINSSLKTNQITLTTGTLTPTWMRFCYLFNGICYHFHLCVDVRIWFIVFVTYLMNAFTFTPLRHGYSRQSLWLNVSDCTNRPSDFDACSFEL